MATAQRTGAAAQGRPGAGSHGVADGDPNPGRPRSGSCPTRGIQRPGRRAIRRIQRQRRHGTDTDRRGSPPSKPAYEDPVPYIEAMAEADILRIAEALVFVRPLTPYPNWYFDADWQNPDLGYRIRRSIWTYFSRRKTTAALDTPWYGGLRLRIHLGNDQSRQQFVAGCIDPNEFALLDKLLSRRDGIPRHRRRMRDAIQCSPLTRVGNTGYCLGL